MDRVDKPSVDCCTRLDQRRQPARCTRRLIATCCLAPGRWQCTTGKWTKRHCVY